MALILRSADVSLDGVLQAAGLPGGSSGLAELDVVLHAAGASPHALAASLTGHVGVAMVDGEIANDALAASLGSLTKQAGAGLEPGGGATSAASPCAPMPRAESSRCRC